MPRITTTASGVPAANHADYPKLMRGKSSGTIYLLTAPKTGTIVHLGNNPWKGRRQSTSKHKLGYYSTRLVESDMVPHTGEVKLAVTA